jgi:outer membrane porin, OprD family
MNHLTRPQILTLCFAATAASVSAQPAEGPYVYPGQPPAGAYTLPGGFMPVVQLRTYYMNKESLTGVQSEAWALGGWAGVRSPWWGDLFQVGLVGFTTQRLYGPEDKDGTLLLAPGQHPITVLGEAFGAVKLFDQTLTGYRQIIDRPFINPQDNRMIPNTFEAYTVTGSASDVRYTGGYITKIKTRNSNSFVPMSTVAGGTGDHQGVVYAGGTWNFSQRGYMRMDEQYGVDTFNTFYVDGKVPIEIDDKTSLTLGAQYYPQKSVGDAQIGSFSTWGAGLQAAIAYGPFGGQLYYTQTGTGFNTQNPWGDHPSYLNLQQVAFNTAGERALGIGGTVNFASLGVPGFTAAAVYASGRDRVDAQTGAPIPDRNETDIRFDYAFAKGTVLEGLIATFRASWLHQNGSPQTATELRAYLNYVVRF